MFMKYDTIYIMSNKKQILIFVVLVLLIIFAVGFWNKKETLGTSEVVEKSSEKKIKKIFGNFYLDQENEILIVDGRKISDIDLDSLEILEENDFYYSDKNGIYYLGEKINNADKKSFEVIKRKSSGALPYPYAKDKDYVYFSTAIIKDADPDSFEIISREYTKDKNYVYFGANKVVGADSDSFEILEYPNAKDKNGKYHKDEKI